MGDFVITIKAVGGHGCQREIKSGGEVRGCGLMGCPDCEARRFVKILQSQGVNVKEATLQHWPEQPGPLDNLLTGIRTRSFAILAAAGALLTALLLPALALAQAPAVVPLEDDPFKLVEQIVQAAGAKNWLLLVPLTLVLAMFVVRKYVGPKVPFLTTDRGGALLALITAVLTAVLTAVMAPGPHTVVSVVVATFTVLATNKMIFLWLNKVVSPTGADKADELEAKVKALEAKLAAGSGQAAAGAANQAVADLKGMAKG